MFESMGCTTSKSSSSLQLEENPVLSEQPQSEQPQVEVVDETLTKKKESVDSTTDKIVCDIVGALPK